MAGTNLADTGDAIERLRDFEKTFSFGQVDW